METHSDERHTGTCLRMCPPGEVKMRKENRLIHRLECVDRPGSRGRARGRGRARQLNRVADEEKMVKEYTRPAAGKVDPRPEDLRTPDTLQHAVRYLLQEVVTRVDVPRCVAYEYIFDRLRAVRQDMVIQRIEGLAAVNILESTIKFLVYSNYRLCEEDYANFDPKINETHLQECLKWLMCLYDEDEPYTTCNMAEFVSMYILFNLGSWEALQLALEKKPHIWFDKVYVSALAMNFAWINHNFVRVFKIARTLPPLLQCAFHKNVSRIQSEALGIMSAGYSSKVLKYPLEKLVKTLRVDTVKDVRDLCSSCGVTVDGEHVKFNKQSSNITQKINPKRYKFIDDELDAIPLPRLLSQNSCQCSDS